MPKRARKTTVKPRATGTPKMVPADELERARELWAREGMCRVDALAEHLGLSYERLRKYVTESRSGRSIGAHMWVHVPSLIAGHVTPGPKRSQGTPKPATTPR